MGDILIVDNDFHVTNSFDYTIDETQDPHKYLVATMVEGGDNG